MKTYLLILGLSTALSAAQPVASHSRGECDRLVLHGRTQAKSLKDSTLQTKVNSLLARAEKKCRAGKRDNGIKTAQSAIGLLK